MFVTVLFWIFVFLVFYTYIGYGMFIYALVKIKEIFLPPKDLPVYSQLPEVTLFITAFNEEDIVDDKMANTMLLDYPADKLKIVWVTDGSTDGTNEKLKNYSNTSIYYSPERLGKTAAMGRGMAFIKTPLVIFTDANTMLNSEAVSRIVKEFADPKTGCVAGEKRIAIQSEDTASSSGEGFYWKYESFLKSLDSRLCTAVGAAGELFGIRTELFENMSSSILLDDFVMSMHIAKKGYKIAYCPDAYAVESGSANMKEEEKRKIRIAAGGLQSIWIHRSLLNIFRYGMLSFQFLSHRVLRWTITPIALFMLLPLNIILCVKYGFSNYLYWIILLLQILFYICGFIGYALSQKKIKNKIFFIPYYFFFMNLNVFKGISYLLKKKGSGAWEKSARK